MSVQPSLFISHGAPNIVLSDVPARHYLENMGRTLSKPKAIIICSAHFEAKGPTVVADPAPGMIYDFGGFEPELYEMVYPAPGSPGLAAHVIDMLWDAGFNPNLATDRGFDHGSWTPLKLMFPQADIPVVQLSIDPSRDARYHFDIGRAIAPLRAENVLIIGSGHITHNLRAIFSEMRQGLRDESLAAKVTAFVDWMASNLESEHADRVLEWKEAAPYAVENHPSDDHLLPLFFSLGAGGEDARGERIHSSVVNGSFAYDFYRFP